MTLNATQLDGAILARITGSVVQTTGLTVAVAGMSAPVGAVVGLRRQSGRR
jgi:flagellum-specific ATP synthase